MKKRILQLLLFLLIGIITACADSNEKLSNSSEKVSNSKTKGFAVKGQNIVINKTKSPENDTSEQRVALVIGNAKYEGVLSKLSNTINDSRAMREIMEKRDFDVIYVEDGTKKEIKSSLNKFYKKLKKGGVGVLYFSGHGLEVDGKNYMIPVDADIKERSDTEYEAICINKVTDRLKNIGNRLNIVILDACRNDPFSRAVGTGGLAKMEPIGLFISYATGAGSVSSDGKAGDHGLFTKYLIENISKPLGLQQVFQKTREAVYEASNHQQFPAIYNQIVKGDFYFTKPPSTPETQTATSTPAPTPTPKVENRTEVKMKDTTERPKEEKKDKWNPKIYDGERSYSKNSKHTVKDNYTNLIWTKDATKKMKWEDALQYCKDLSLDGYRDWDLPTKKELQYLSDTSKFAPVIDTNYFNVPRDITHHWTKTLFEADKSRAFGINFLAGGYDNYNKSEDGYVFCVSRK